MLDRLTTTDTISRTMHARASRHSTIDELHSEFDARNNTRTLELKERQSLIVKSQNRTRYIGGSRIAVIQEDRTTQLEAMDRSVIVTQRPYTHTNIREYSPDPNFDNPLAWQFNNSWVYDSAMNIDAPSGFTYTYPLGGSAAMGLVIGDEYTLKLVCSAISSHLGVVYANNTLLWRSDTEGIGEHEYKFVWSGTSTPGFLIGGISGAIVRLDSLSLTGGGGG